MVDLLLEATNLGIRFGGVWALRDFSLTIDEGEVHGFIGPNGSGKSTLFNLIIGRYRPTTGDVSFEGRSLRGLAPDQRARLGISIKFQITSVFSELTVLDNIRLGVIAHLPLLRGLRAGARRNANWDVERAEEILDTMGLIAKRNHLAGTLAHGEKGWLEIGMAIAAQPRLLLLDEPTSGMGRDETKKTVDLVRRIRTGRTILVVEHDMEFVRAVAERITVLFKGSVLTEGTYDEVRKDPRVIEAYLGRGREHATLGS